MIDNDTSVSKFQIKLNSFCSVIINFLCKYNAIARKRCHPQCSLHELSWATNYCGFSIANISTNIFNILCTNILTHTQTQQCKHIVRVLILFKISYPYDISYRPIWIFHLIRCTSTNVSTILNIKFKYTTNLCLHTLLPNIIKC